MSWVIVVATSLGIDCVFGGYGSEEAARRAWRDQVRGICPVGAVGSFHSLIVDPAAAASRFRQSEENA